MCEQSNLGAKGLVFSVSKFLYFSKEDYLKIFYLNSLALDAEYSPLADQMKQKIIDCGDFANFMKVDNSEALRTIVKTIISLLTGEEYELPDGLVTFGEAHNPNYGFDKYKYEPLWIFYEHINIGETEYHVPWKAIEMFQSDNVYADISGNLGSSLTFTSDYGTLPPPTAVPDNDSLNLSLTGKADGDIENITATYTDQYGETVTVGKLRVKSYEPVKRNLIIVPINGNELEISSADEIQTYINNVYKQAAVKWTVTLHDGMTEVEFNENDDPRLDDETTVFTAYTKEMRNIIDSYEELNNTTDKTYVLFLMHSSEKGKAGFMPLKKHYGFIFMDEFRSSNTEELHRTVSHEVAHGAFVLYHTFSEFPALQQATTDNLMDYATGTRLYKYQWDLIHDPVWLIFGGGSEEEGADIVNIERFFRWIRENKYPEMKVNWDKCAGFGIVDEWFFPTLLKSTFGGEDFSFELDLEESGTIDLSKAIPKISFEDDHAKFYLEFNYHNTDEYAIQFKTYTYTDLELLVSKLEFPLPDIHNQLKNLYNDAIIAGENDCDLLDVIYETIPNFVVNLLKMDYGIGNESFNEKLWADLEALAYCNINDWGTNENLSIINILKAFDNSYAYNNINNNPLPFIHIADNEKIDEEFKTDFYNRLCEIAEIGSNNSNLSEIPSINLDVEVNNFGTEENPLYITEFIDVEYNATENKFHFRYYIKETNAMGVGGDKENTLSEFDVKPLDFINTTFKKGEKSYSVPALVVYALISTEAEEYRKKNINLFLAAALATNLYNYANTISNIPLNVSNYGENKLGLEIIELCTKIVEAGVELPFDYSSIESIVNSDFMAKLAYMRSEPKIIGTTVPFEPIIPPNEADDIDLLKILFDILYDLYEALKENEFDLERLVPDEVSFNAQSVSILNFRSILGENINQTLQDIPNPFYVMIRGLTAAGETESANTTRTEVLIVTGLVSTSIKPIQYPTINDIIEYLPLRVPNVGNTKLIVPSLRVFMDLRNYLQTDEIVTVSSGWIKPVFDDNTERRSPTILFEVSMTVAFTEAFFIEYYHHYCANSDYNAGGIRIGYQRNRKDAYGEGYGQLLITPFIVIINGNDEKEIIDKIIEKLEKEE